MDNNKRNIEIVRSNISVFSGGTRNAIKFGRPWQQEIVIDRTKCPFCKRQQNIVKQYNSWNLAKNRFTPFQEHYLLIPNDCWEPNVMRQLGGNEQLRTMFQLLEEKCLQGVVKHIEDVLMNVHVGAAAGQNIAHPHFHVLASSEMHAVEVPGGGTLFYEDVDFQVRSGGIRIGQCQIRPCEGRKGLVNLAGLLSRIISLYNEKFVSDQGIGPDYGITLHYRNGQFVQGWYVPILNHLGVMEWGSLSGFNVPFFLPWTHDFTAKYLRGEITREQAAKGEI